MKLLKKYGIPTHGAAYWSGQNVKYSCAVKYRIEIGDKVFTPESVEYQAAKALVIKHKDRLIKNPLVFWGRWFQPLVTDQYTRVITLKGIFYVPRYKESTMFDNGFYDLEHLTIEKVVAFRKKEDCLILERVRRHYCI